MTSKEFFQYTYEVYDFLVNDYGYNIYTHSDNQLSYSVIYKSKNRAIQVYFEVLDKYSSVMLYRLNTKGDIPNWDDTTNSVPLHKILSKRIQKPKITDIANSEGFSFVDELKTNALALKNICSDILKGEMWISFSEIKPPPIRVYNQDKGEWEIINDINDLM